MDTFLQIWGGVFYLLNKFFFSRAERTRGDLKRQWRIRAWAVYLVGLPAILVFYGLQSNWMVVFVEAGGGPGMLFGLIAARRGLDHASKFWERFAIGAAVVGIAVSLIHIGWFTRITQVFELGLAAGFLCGTILVAKQKGIGYLFYMLMIGSNLFLLSHQDGMILFGQQIL